MFESVVAFSDDLITFSRDMNTHIKVHLPQLFARLRKFNVRLKASKVDLCTDSFIWCGYVISSNGVSVDPTKYEAIEKLHQPQTLKQLRSFLGSCNFLRRWIPKFADIVEPVRVLLKKGCFTKKWSSNQVKAFLERLPFRSNRFLECDEP